MRRAREILRLKFEHGASDRGIAVAVSVARSTVQLCLLRAAAAGLSWPLPPTLTDQGLEAKQFAARGGSKPGQRRKAEPDWTAIHHELRRPGVTLLLLWEEYRAVHTTGYGYSRWCELYRSWEARLSPTMRQAHPAGERLYVDYAGQTVEVVDGRTGVLRATQVFVAVLGASNYTYAEARWSEGLADWIGVHVNALASSAAHRSCWSATTCAPA
jgi:transposase